MLVAVVYLLCWDGDRLWAAGWHVLGTRPTPSLLAEMSWLERAGWLLGGTAGSGAAAPREPSRRAASPAGPVGGRAPASPRWFCPS